MEIEMPAAAQSDVWTSILSQKHTRNDAYIHPLVKRSSSSLSDESLQICTESLGSETGSDICLSEDEQLREHCHQQHQHNQQQQGKGYGIQFPNKSYCAKVSAASKSFPPPLTSLCRVDAPSIRMHSHRQNGRLVLEAVSVPSQSYFNAQRHDGRLTLTFAKTPIVSMEEEDESNEHDDEEEDDEEEQDEAINCDTGILGVVASRRSPVPQVMNNLNYKLRPLANENPTTWVRHNEQDVQQQEAGTRLNVYENSWKDKATNVGNAYMQKTPPVKNHPAMGGRHEEQQNVVMNDHGCKDSRASFLFWDQATLNCVV